nr:hypothetical protein [Jannaschia sp. Os4]
MDETGDDAIIGRVTKVLADQSQTLEEAFVVSLRVQMAARRAKALVARTRAAHEAEQAAAPAPAAPSDG